MSTLSVDTVPFRGPVETRLQRLEYDLRSFTATGERSLHEVRLARSAYFCHFFNNRASMELTWKHVTEDCEQCTERYNALLRDYQTMRK